jgi:hypothetical protein
LCALLVGAAVIAIITAFVAAGCTGDKTHYRRLPVEVYRDKMKAGWIGQIAGVSQAAAERMLSSPAYRAPLGKNAGFLLMHCVGSIPHNYEIDTPLVYADYYFMEALQRYRNTHNRKLNL